MDFQSLAAIIEEAAPLLSGARVNRVYESETGDIIILLRKERVDRCLLVAPDRSLPRVHLLSRKPPARTSLHGFTLFLKSRIAGGTIEAVRLLNNDRIVELLFECRGSGFRFLAELFGSSGNLIITDREGLIQNIYYPAAVSRSGVRLLMPGVRYLPPEQKTSQKDGTRTSGKTIALTGERTDSPNRQAESFFQQVLERRTLEAHRANLLSTVRKTIRRTERKLAALEDDRGRAERAEDHRRAGDLILSNIARVHTGMNEAELEGPDGAMITIALDPRRSPAANAERYFKRYKKAKAGRSVIEKRAGDAVKELSFLRSLAVDLENASDENELARLRAKFGRTDLLPAGKGTGKQTSATPSDPFRRIPYRGWEILVGRNARGNDYLTTKIARDGDLWLHAEGLPGSHVVVRNPHGRDIPSDVIERAASLAAHYSKGREAGKVPVTYTFARSVRKPKGAKPGLVALADRKTMMSVPQGEQNDDE